MQQPLNGKPVRSHENAIVTHTRTHAHTRMTTVPVHGRYIGLHQNNMQRKSKHFQMALACPPANVNVATWCHKSTSACVFV